MRQSILTAVVVTVALGAAGAVLAAEETVEHRMQYEEQHYKVETVPQPRIEKRTTVETVPAPPVVEKRTTVETVPAAPQVIEKRTETKETVE